VRVTEITQGAPAAKALLESSAWGGPGHWSDLGGEDVGLGIEIG
jgi:hypothetical protein